MQLIFWWRATSIPQVFNHHFLPMQSISGNDVREKLSYALRRYTNKNLKRDKLI